MSYSTAKKFRRWLSFDGFWISLAIIWPFFFLFQGLCVGDFGYVTSIYKLFFDHFSELGRSNVTWLSNFVGAVWYNYVSAGATGFRVLGAIILSSSAFLSYWLAPKKSFKFFGFSLFFVIVWIKKEHLDWFYYDHLAGALALLSILFLFHSLPEGKKIPFFWPVFSRDWE